MTETSTTRWRESINEYGIAGPLVVAVVTGAVYYGVHEVFHILLGAGFVIDTVGSVALGAVAAVGVYALGWNLRAVVASFVGLFVTHTLVMGHGGALAFSSFGWSAPVAVVAAIVFFLAAGGLSRSHAQEGK